MDAAKPRGAVLVLPTVAAGQQGPVAAWVSTAGWASAARRLVGAAWTITPSGVRSEAELRAGASRAALGRVAGPRWSRRVPVVAKTGLKDAREWARARRFARAVERTAGAPPWRGYDVAFVWQRHELFHTAGLRLARTLHVPSVLFVPAPLVWQAGQWGVRRPGWARLVERVGERAPLRAADLVACGTEEVAQQVRRLGVEPDRVVITPTGIDPEVFAGSPDVGSPDVGRDARRRSLGLDGRFVVGWVGSFRRFHALEQAVEAMRGLDGATLLLVGDGPERPRLEALARRCGVDVRATGTVPHDEIPSHLGAMDAALVLAAPGAPFHYSPLKLAEYLAAGRAVVAPRAGALGDLLHDGVDALLVTPGSTDELGAALRRLRDDAGLRDRLGAAARAAATARWSWDRSLERVLAALADGPRGAAGAARLPREEGEAGAAAR